MGRPLAGAPPPLAPRGDLALGDDTQLHPGDLWRAGIRAAIDNAAASVLLISADFLASDFVVSDNLATAAPTGRTGRHQHHPNYRSTLSSQQLPLFGLLSRSQSADDAVEQVALRGRGRRVCPRRRAGGPGAEALAGVPPGSGGPGGPHAHASDDIFHDLLTAAIATAILMQLASKAHVGASNSLSELTHTLDMSSLKPPYHACGTDAQSRVDSE